MKIVILNKPYDVLSQFRADEKHQTMADFTQDPDLRIAGRLDLDSEGLLLLSDDGARIAQISSPKFKWPKTYLLQVEGDATEEQLEQLRAGIVLKDGSTLPAQARKLERLPDWLWPRTPPVRFRKSVAESFLEVTIKEGRNRQVRRMTAAVGLPTLRLVRISIGPHRLDGLAPGEWREEVE